MIKPKLYKAKEKYTGETVIGYPFREFIVFDTTQQPPKVIRDGWVIVLVKTGKLGSSGFGIQGFTFDKVYIDENTLEECDGDGSDL